MFAIVLSNDQILELLPLAYMFVKSLFYILLLVNNVIHSSSVSHYNNLIKVHIITIWNMMGILFLDRYH